MRQAYGEDVLGDGDGFGQQDVAHEYVFSARVTHAPGIERTSLAPNPHFLVIQVLVFELIRDHWQDFECCRSCKLL